jgi:hypothetical protein|tara:strand:+ start:523 stop:1005 length:483 start_codon:yes stop_codon:yes gene_type:complete
MATVAQVAKASLQRILVQASEAPLEPDEYQDFIFSMNNYMTQLDAQGVQLGYTEVSNLGDEVTIPAGALRGLIANMAIEVAPDYSGVISQGLVKAAREGYITMQTIGQTMGGTRMPSTLPIGSGNEDRLYSYSGHFYADSEADILAETTGAIGLETNTDG